MQLTGQFINAIISGNKAYLESHSGLLEPHHNQYPVDSYGNSALAIAALNNQLEIVSWLCEKKLCDLFQVNTEGWTAITLAANRKLVKIVKFIQTINSELFSNTNLQSHIPGASSFSMVST